VTPFRHAKLESADPRAVVLMLDGGWRMRVTLVAPGIGRALLLPPEGLREPRTWSVIDGQARDPWQGADRSALFADAPAATLTRDGDSITLTDDLLRVHIALNPPGLTWEQWQGSGWQTCCTDRPTFGYGSAARSGLTGHWQRRDEHDQYFGLGDKTGPLNKAGRRFRTRQLDALGYNGENSDPLYKHWPFFIGRRADSGACYGVFYDTLAECTFDFGQEFDNYHGFYRATEIADGDLDCYVLAGPDVAGAVTRFVKLIGGTAMPPRWSLGYANTAMALADVPDAQNRIAEFLATAKRLQFPLSSFHFGSGYTSRGNRRYVFTWNRDKFPEPAGLLQAFRDAGVRTVANIKPCLLDDHPAFEAVAAAGGFIREEGGAICLDPFWDGWGAHLDFTRDGDRHWWQDNLQHQVLEMGFDAGWNDNNEYPIWNEAGVTHANGQSLPIHRSRPLHPMLMTEATAERQRALKPDERTYTITRAGAPGIQRTAQTWSGDNTTSWHTLRWNQRMALTMSLSGMFNIGHDIGGFFGPTPDAELLIRWTQACCLVPRMIMNSWKADGSVNTPWLHPEATDTIRSAVRLRLRLMPTLYTLIWQAAARHCPVLRPTFFHFGDDATCWQDNDEMMIGPDLMVAPVFASGQRERTLYLPKGANAVGWFDFWSGRYWPAGQTVTVPAELERLPLFVRAGALLATTDTWQDEALTEEPSRALHYYPPPADAPASRSSAELFEDDGLQAGNAPAHHRLHRFEATANRNALRISASDTGAWPLPYTQIRVVLPKGEQRPLTLAASRIALTPPPAKDGSGQG
jgi:alpha-glucosidase